MTAKILPNEESLRSLAEFEPISHESGDLKLGKGSFASVQLVRERKSAKLFALKKVKLHYLTFIKIL